MQRAGTNRSEEALSVSEPPERPEPLELDGLALFLDLDGVLAPIAARPEDVVPVAARTALLKALQAALGGRLAVISGRTIADLDRILDGSVAALAGVHGLERRGADGRTWARRAQQGAGRGALGLRQPDPGLAGGPDRGKGPQHRRALSRCPRRLARSA